jgi:threonine/homoserine/homoserine lactone efflux protein
MELVLDVSRFWLFLAAALVLLVVPGPAVLYIVTRSIDQGRVAGALSALGVGLGNSVHALAAALGLSAILASSAIAFSVVKYLGAAYLIYLGVRRLLSHDDHEPVIVKRQRLPRVFSQGALVAVLNPKTALFFLAFLPQFIDASRGAVWEQTLVLGLAFVVLGICTDSVYAMATGTAGRWLKERAGFLRGQRYVSGGVYVTLGVTTAISGSGKD